MPPNVYVLGNCPHEWLFPRVAACVHHGGAGTVAASLRAGRPTLVCPFFGDQHMWGAMVHRCGAGPQPVPISAVNAASLTEAFRQAAPFQPASQRGEMAPRAPLRARTRLSQRIFPKEVDSRAERRRSMSLSAAAARRTQGAQGPGHRTGRRGAGGSIRKGGRRRQRCRCLPPEAPA
eukprot:2780197-Prymnesium_polylepis.3